MLQKPTPRRKQKKQEPKVTVENGYPDKDTLNIDVNGVKICISRDENNIVYVDINPPNDATQSYVLGEGEDEEE